MQECFHSPNLTQLPFRLPLEQRRHLQIFCDFCSLSNLICSDAFLSLTGVRRAFSGQSPTCIVGLRLHSFNLLLLLLILSSMMMIIITIIIVCRAWAWRVGVVRGSLGREATHCLYLRLRWWSPSWSWSKESSPCQSLRFSWILQWLLSPTGALYAFTSQQLFWITTTSLMQCNSLIAPNSL